MTIKEHFTDLFQYHAHFNYLYIELFKKNEDEISDKVLQIFSHCMNGHQIWNARILKTETDGVFDVHLLKNMEQLTAINFRDSRVILEKYNLDDELEYVNSKGEKFTNTIGDILFQVCNHYTYHRGQISAELRNFGLEPIPSDFIFYKRHN